ncbi:hypothetical protein NE237_032316 [Protea cynaroides]|uniref:Uncharacterized protein n=1 Tax=Protea cynaroides TaxID=273540 RepID=A0A9Q0R3A2_9MAGN|nr:hypothetical protein NE237_032316 [Protea cynaroides]
MKRRNHPHCRSPLVRDIGCGKGICNSKLPARTRIKATAQHFKYNAVESNPAFRDIILIHFATMYIPIQYSFVRQPERHSWTLFRSPTMHRVLSKARRHERSPSLSIILRN